VYPKAVFAGKNARKLDPLGGGGGELWASRSSGWSGLVNEAESGNGPERSEWRRTQRGRHSGRVLQTPADFWLDERTGVVQRQCPGRGRHLSVRVEGPGGLAHGGAELRKFRAVAAGRRPTPGSARRRKNGTGGLTVTIQPFRSNGQLRARSWPVLSSGPRSDPVAVCGGLSLGNDITQLKRAPEADVRRPTSLPNCGGHEKLRPQPLACEP